MNTGDTGITQTSLNTMLGTTGISYSRYSTSQLASIYAGFDVRNHTTTHPSLDELTEANIITQVQGNADTLESLLGYMSVGVAWPGGESEVDDFVREVVMRNTEMRYGIGTTSTGSFALPEAFMYWLPTASFVESGTDALIDSFIATAPTGDQLLTLWCHGYELDQYDYWDEFEAMIAKLATAAEEEGSEIVFVTNSKFYQLFKNEIPAMPVSDSEADAGRHLDMAIVGDGEDIYSLPSSLSASGYRYGAQYLYSDDGQTVYAYYSTPGESRVEEWDWLTFRMSTDGGKTWSAEKVVIAPTMNSKESYSVCDPSVVYDENTGYWYIAYTSTVGDTSMVNNVYVARSKNPDGPFDKWDGEG